MLVLLFFSMINYSSMFRREAIELLKLYLVVLIQKRSIYGVLDALLLSFSQGKFCFKVIIKLECWLKFKAWEVLGHLGCYSMEKKWKNISLKIWFYSKRLFKKSEKKERRKKEKQDLTEFTCQNWRIWKPESNQTTKTS